jgi:DNA-binding response OmpR family regulator
LSNLIEVYIQRLRRKIDDGHAVKLIHTRRGAGYTLEAAPPDDGDA